MKPVTRRYEMGPIDEIVLYTTDTKKVSIPAKQTEIFLFDNKIDGYYPKFSISVVTKENEETKFIVHPFKDNISEEELERYYSAKNPQSIEELFKLTGVLLTEEHLDIQQSRVLACNMVGQAQFRGWKYWD